MNPNRTHVLKFPVLRYLRKGERASFAVVGGVYPKEAPCDGLHVSWRNDVMFLTCTDLENAGWTRKGGK